MHRIPRRILNRTGHLVVCLSLLCAAGCGGTRGPQISTRRPATPDQLQAAYPDLASGRFVVLGDFNTEDQLGGITPAMRIGHGRGATGGGAAVARVSAGQPVSIEPSVTDWSGQTLLLCSVRVDLPQSLAVTVAGDGGAWRRDADLASGWNLLRFDIGEIGMRVDTGQVRRIDLVPSAATELAIDDLLLADDRSELKAESPRITLRTETRGLRVHSGVAGAFELVFQGGLLVDWRSWSEVPLGGSTGVGPWLVAVGPDWNQQPPPTPGGPDSLAGRQRVLESGLRTVVQAETPTGRRQWTVYPHGAAFLSIQNPRVRDGQRAAFLLSVAGTGSFEALPGPALSPGERPLGLCLLQQEGPDPDLLWAPGNPTGGRRLTQRFSPGSTDLLVLMGDDPPGPLAQAFFVSEDELLPERAADLTHVYQHPPRPKVTTGRLVTDRAGDLNGDGFNESEGCYELAGRDRRLRMRLAPEAAPLDHPVFRVQGTRGLRCWVYVNGRIVSEIGRDADGELLFVVPGRHAGPLTIEVTAVPVGGGAG